MANPISNRELLGLMATDSPQRDALLTPVSNVDTATNNLVRSATGLYENLDNLTGNIVDVFDFSGKSNLSKNIRRAINNEESNVFEKALDVTKAYFQEPTTSGGFSATLDLFSPVIDDAIREANQEAILERTRIQQHQALMGQYATGGAGDALTELFLAVPTMNVGSMSRTFASQGGLQSAKAISLDALSNSNKFAGSEFVLQKAYGRSDEEAMASAMAAKLIGGFGTVGVGVAHKGLKAMSEAEVKLQNELAGGGVPTKQQMDEMMAQRELDELERDTYQPDVTPTKEKFTDSKGQIIDTPTELEAKKAVEDLTYKSVDPEATPRKPLENQKQVDIEERTFKTEIKPEFRKRVMTKEKTYRSIQGGSTQKAGIEIQPKAKIDTVEDVDKVVKSEVKMFEEDQALKSAYGQKQAKFKEQAPVSKQQKDIDVKDFEYKKLRQISKDESVAEHVREYAKQKAFKLKQTKLNKSGASQKQIDSATKKYYSQIKVSQPTTKSKNIVNKELRQQFITRSKNNTPAFNAEAEAKLQAKSGEIVSAVERQIKAVEYKVKDAVQNLKIKEGLRGKRFSEKAISDEQLRKYRDEAKLIQDYQHAISDLQSFKNGKISAREFVFRSGQRLEDKIAREGKTSFKDDKELSDYMHLIEDSYKELGVTKKVEKVEPEKFAKKETETGASQAEKDDFAEGKRLEREAQERDKAKLKNQNLIKSIDDYRRTGIVPRSKKTGKPLLSNKQKALADRSEIPSNMIADLSHPIVPSIDKADAIANVQKKIGSIANTEAMKRLGMKGILTKEGPKFREQKPFDIMHKQSIVDASNSAGQILAVITGSKRLGSLTKLTGNTLDLRSEIAKRMTENTGRAFTKDDVKPAFIQQMYGETARQTKKVFELEEDFFAYEKALEEIAPEIKQFREEIYKLMDNGQKDFNWKLPDGATVKFTLEGVDKASMKIGDKTVDIQVKTGDINMMSRALMPNIIHSIDAYVVRQLNKKGIPTIHDAFSETADIGSEAVQDAFLDAMIKLNDSNVLHDIMTDIGYTGKPLKQGTLTKDDILRSRNISAEVEHKAGVPEEAKLRKLDNSKVLSDEELMKEFMAKDMSTSTGANYIVEELVDSAPFNPSIAIAKEGDSVMQRQVALAHQSPNFNKELSIQPPEGIDEKMFWKVQRELFDEARAKLEYNPLTENSILGEPRFFKNQKPLNDTTIGLEKLIQQEKRIDGNFKAETPTPKARRLETQSKPIESVPDEIKTELDKSVSDAIQDTYEIKKELGFNNPFRETITNWKSGYKSDGAYEQVNKLHILTRQALDKSAKVGQVTKNMIDSLYKRTFTPKQAKQFDRDFQLSVIDTDAISHGFKKQSDAMAYLNENKALYKRLQKEIDQSAKGMKFKGEMNHPDYYPNTAVLAKAKGLTPDEALIVDKLISIKAMQDGNWKFIEEFSDHVAYRTLEQILKRAKAQTDELFENDPTYSMKGYRLETYDSLYKMQDGKLSLDVGGGIEQGALPVNIKSKRVGERGYDFRVDAEIKELKERGELNPNFTKEDHARMRYEEALERGLGLVLDMNGNPVAMRKVASEAERNLMGRQVSALETLSATLESNVRKLAQSDGVIKEAVRMLDEGNDIFSKDMKEGFVTLTKEERHSLPKELRDIRFVHPDFKHMLMGNKEIQVFHKGMLSVIEQIYKDGFVHFKQNVVLKNPASWVNNYMFGMFMNVNAGLSPKVAFNYSKKAPALYKEMQNLTERLIKHDLDGTMDSPMAQHVKRSLEQNELYQMVQEGMAVSVMADLIKTSGKSVLFTDKAVGKGLRKVIGDKAVEVLSNVYLHQSSKTGRIANSMFTRIDVMHRYALVKGMMDKGMSMKDAVAKSNGVYGDLDKIAPMWSQAIQHYGFVPFSNWFFRVSGGLQDVTKRNIGRTIAIMAGLYGLSELTGKRTESWNPLLTLVNSPIDMVAMSPYNHPVNALKNSVQPKVYSKAYNAVKNNDPLSFAISNEFKG